MFTAFFLPIFSRFESIQCAAFILSEVNKTFTAKINPNISCIFFSFFFFNIYAAATNGRGEHVRASSGEKTQTEGNENIAGVLAQLLIIYVFIYRTGY